MKIIQLECEYCGTEFDRALKEHRRNQKIGRRTFCNLRCSMAFQNIVNPPTGNLANFKGKQGGLKLDKLSPFRWYCRTIKARSIKRNQSTDIDADYLYHLWTQQQGTCPYTGLKMSLPRGISSTRIDDPCHASLDRIDSAIGYRKGNVEFVCLSINYGKNGFSKEKMKNFVDAIRNHGKMTTVL